jgi:hypothetical protein
MATTTNYGWVTPDDTALVKDGAAAIRTLGTSVDTTTKNLNPSTTLGDIEYRSSTSNTNTRVGIGSSGQALTVVAGVPSWAASATSVLTTTGDTLYASAANTLTRRAIGSTGDVLTVSGGLPTWAAPAAGGMTLLSTTTLSGTSTTISSISGAYNNLQIVISGSVGGGLPAIRPNGSASITYAATQKNSTNGNINGGVWYFTEFGQTNNAGVITIYNYASATYRKPFFAMSGYDASGSFEAKSFHGYINTTSAITSIEINGSGDTFTGGQVLIYGVK